MDNILHMMQARHLWHCKMLLQIVVTKSLDVFFKNKEV